MFKEVVGFAEILQAKTYQLVKGRTSVWGGAIQVCLVRCLSALACLVVHEPKPIVELEFVST